MSYPINYKIFTKTNRPAYSCFRYSATLISVLCATASPTQFIAKRNNFLANMQNNYPMERPKYAINNLQSISSASSSKPS